MASVASDLGSSSGARQRAPRRRPFDAFPYGMVAAVVLLEVLFVAVPLLIGAWYSLHKVDYLQLGRFVGLENFWWVLNSRSVRNAFLVTSIFSFFALFFTFLSGFGLALLLERDSRLHVFGRAVVLIPYVISMLVGSMLLKWLFSPDGGVSSLLLTPLGMADTSILADPENAMAALVFNAVWRDSAFAMILLMAGLKAVPLQLYQAAKVDGASAFYRFRRITLPLMRVPILVTLVRLLIHFVNVLTFALVLTSGGPNETTNTLGLELYRIGFIDFRFGQANALAILVFIFNILLVLLVVRLFEQKRGRF